jgi:hypothetical protein
MESMRELIDRIKKSGATPSTPGQASGGDTSARNPLGLMFAPGARVIDLATGGRAQVQSGSRDAANNEQVFRVLFDDGRIGYRHAGEIERDPQAVPVIGAVRS